MHSGLQTVKKDSSSSTTTIMLVLILRYYVILVIYIILPEFINRFNGVIAIIIIFNSKDENKMEEKRYEIRHIFSSFFIF